MADSIAEDTARRSARRNRRRHVAIEVATGVVLVGAVAAAGSACGSDDGEPVLAGRGYVDAMNAICDDTEARLAELPEPPEQISAVDWATEVARAFRAEATAASNLVVDASVREAHRSYTVTTEDLVDRYDELSVTLSTAPDDIGEISTAITELSLGRDDVAAGLGLESCVRSTR